MKIYTRIECLWNPALGRYDTVRSEWFDYVGPIAHCGDGGEGATYADSGETTGGGDTKNSAATDSPSGGGSPTTGGDTSGSSGNNDVLKGVGDAAAKTAAQTAVLAGASALANRKTDSQADAFNKQLSGLVTNANSQSYGAAQAAPITPGLSGSTGKPGSPEATVANMNLPAPVTSTSTSVGTQPAPSTPTGGGQTGAIKLGTRPQSYA